MLSSNLRYVIYSAESQLNVQIEFWVEDADGLELQKVQSLNRDDWSAFEDGGGISIRNRYTDEYIVYQRAADRFFRYSTNYDPYGNGWYAYAPFPFIAVQEINWNLHTLSAGMTPMPDNTDGLAEGTTNLYYTEDRVAANSAVVANTAKRSYPVADQLKLSSIQVGAEQNVNADWDATSGDAQILNKPNVPEGLGDLSGSTDDIVEGSTNLFITPLQEAKLEGIEDGAQANIQADWSEANTLNDAYIKNKPDLAAVALSGDYYDLINLPAQHDQFFQVNSTAVTAFTLNQYTAGNYLRFTASSAVVVTIPASTFSIGDEVVMEQAGTGQVEVVAGSGVTLNNSASNTAKTAEQYSIIAIKCVAADEFTLTGERELV